MNTTIPQLEAILDAMDTVRSRLDEAAEKSDHRAVERELNVLRGLAAAVDLLRGYKAHEIFTDMDSSEIVKTRMQ